MPALTAFHDVRFPDHISYGSSGGPMFNTTIMGLTSGFERRNINWSQVRGAYEAVHGIKDRADMETIQAFFYARMGRAYSFRYKDWADYETGAQVLGVGDGVTTDYQIVKNYVSGGFSYKRNISKLVYTEDDGITPRNTLVNVAVDLDIQVKLVDYTVDDNTGIISFVVPPALGTEVSIGNVEFDVHVRFDTDHLNAVHDFWETQSWPSIPLVEIKESV